MIPPFQIQYPKKIPGRTFWSNWWRHRSVCDKIEWYSTIDLKSITGPPKWFSISSFVRCCLVRWEILDMSQMTIVFMKSIPHVSFKSDYYNTADVPSFSLRIALSATSFVSELTDVDARWFQNRSSHTLPNSKELSNFSTCSLTRETFVSSFLFRNARIWLLLLKS